MLDSTIEHLENALLELDKIGGAAFTMEGLTCFAGLDKKEARVIREAYDSLEDLLIKRRLDQ